MMFGLFTRQFPPPEIRPADTGDADACAAVHRAGFERPWDRYEFERLLAGSGMLAHVAVARQLVIGFCLCRLAADEAEILSIAVDPGRRRTGVGHLLLARQISELPYSGVRRLFLEVEEGNAPALALYHRLGFAEVGRRQSYYRKADGSHAAALVMRRDLS